MTKQRNYSIDLMRLVCSLLVIGIHTDIFRDFSSGLSVYFVQHICRIAVPFFLTVSGFYFVKRINDGKDIKKFLFRLIRMYCVWSLILFIETGVSKIINHVSLYDIIKTFLLSFFFNGITEPMWFFPALIYSLIIVAFVKKIKITKVLYFICLVLYAISCIIDFHDFLLPNNRVISYLLQHSWFYSLYKLILIGLPFVTLGVFIQEKRILYKKYILSIFSLLYCIEAAVVCFILKDYSITQTVCLLPLVGSLFVFLHYHPIKNKFVSKFGGGLRDIATFTYLIHPIIIDCFLFANGHFLKTPISETPRFIIVAFVSLLISFVLVKIKFLKRILI